MQENKRRWLVLAVLALAQFMVVLDVSIVNVALASIQRALNFTVTNLQWIISAYTLSFGGFLLLGGRAADLFGRRRVFLTGLFGFATMSLLVGLSQSETQMIIFRALQGLSGAFMSPAALSIILTTFTEGSERNRALSIWGAVAAGGAAAGLLIGGILTEYLGWRFDFFVNLPVALIVAYFTLKLVPAHMAEERTKSLDLPGAVLVTSGLMLLVYTLTNAHAWGWSSLNTVGLGALSILLLLGFIFNESRARHPLMPLSVFNIGNIRGANLTQLPVTASLFSMFFFVSLYVQNILGYSPLRAGLSFLPITILVGLSSILAPNLIKRVGYKPILVVAPLLLMGGLYYLAQIPAVGGSYYLNVFPGQAFMAIGLGMAFVSLTIAATTGIPPHESGLASGLLNTSQQIGGAVGLAILSSVAATASTAVEGFHAAFYTSMGIAFLAMIFALFFIRGRRKQI
jgi:EmrB/QacA subfamily drug resistance transporter